MHQDAFLYAGLFDGAERAQLDLGAARKGYVHVVGGRISVNGERLEAGDALKIAGGPIRLEGGQGAEVLVFDLPA